jgi:hypothetical protein
MSHLSAGSGPAVQENLDAAQREVSSTIFCKGVFTEHILRGHLTYFPSWAGSEVAMSLQPYLNYLEWMLQWGAAFLKIQHLSQRVPNAQ